MTKKYFDVYSIIEREDSEKNLWVKIGVAFENRDGSYNLQLNALPINGKLHMREHVEYEETQQRPQPQQQRPQPQQKQQPRRRDSGQWDDNEPRF